MDAGSTPASSIFFCFLFKFDCKITTKVQFFLYSILSGVLLSIGWPTDGNPIYLFIAFVPILYAEEYFRGSILYKSLFSFITFFIWNLTTTWWLHYAKRNDGSFAIEASLIPSFLNSFFMSIVFTTYSFIKKYIKNKKIEYTFLICFWILLEKIHLEWELSWPWLNLGNGFSNRIEWIQWYEYTGVLGGTIWIWIVNVGITNAFIQYKKKKNRILFYKRLFFNFLKISLLILISNLIYLKYQNQYHNDKGIEVLILQPNIDPYKKYYLSTQKTIDQFKKLINKKIYKNPLFIITPETSFPGNGKKIEIKDIKSNRIVCIFKNFLKKNAPKSVFITGMELFNIYDEKKNKSETSIPILLKKEKKRIDFFNSIVQIEGDNNNHINDVFFYHKSKLVPAIEFFPYKNILFPIINNIFLIFEKSFFLVRNLGKNKNPVVFKHRYLKLKVAPIICYESVFGEYVSRFFKKNAEFMVIITNDGWWGKSQGYKQHMYYSRLRAIENRKYIARSANTGISCFIDEKGEIITSLPYGKEGSLSYKIYPNKIKTFYTKYGDFLFKISYLTIIIIFIYFVIGFFGLNKKEKL